jgi:demethylmenaquinone methyltransferase/2-methoxy-6-polyprenyl-1,4-benzoquinol methylase
MKLPAPDDKARAVRTMFDSIAGRYDLVNRVMTFGLDQRWRRWAVRQMRLAPGSVVLDLACGTGDFCRELERAGYRAVGVDFAHEMLRAASTRAPLVQADILRLPMRDASVDAITCGFALRNVSSIPALFAEAARVVRPGGRAVLLEVSAPRNTLARAVHGFYFNRVVPVIGGVLSSKEAYQYLPASVSYLPEPRALAQMLLDAGFKTTARATLSGGAVQVLAGTRR